MKEYKEYKNKNGGFTLVETLSVVAVMVILLAFGALGIARYRDYLKITEMDNMAREIYMAAQNRAVLLHNSGRLKSELGGTGETNQTFLLAILSSWAMTSLSPPVLSCLLMGAVPPALIRMWLRTTACLPRGPTIATLLIPQEPLPILR